MVIGDRSFSIQASPSCFLVFLFPTVKAGTRHLKFPAGFGDTPILCKFQYGQLQPNPQFFLGFWVHIILRFTPSILLQNVSEDMTYYNISDSTPDSVPRIESPKDIEAPKD